MQYDVLSVKKQTAFQKWFETFLNEKDLEPESWEIEYNGEMNFIDSEVVIEAILNCSKEEQAGIKNMIVRLDFVNAPIMPYFKHLATGLIANR